MKGNRGKYVPWGGPLPRRWFRCERPPTGGGRVRLRQAQAWREGRGLGKKSKDSEEWYSHLARDPLGLGDG